MTTKSFHFFFAIAGMMAAVVFLTVASQSVAQPAIWVGTTSDDWNTGSNWDINGVPDFTLDDAAVIDNGDTVVLSAAAAFQSPELELTGSGLVIDTGGQITFGADANINAGSTLTVVGNGQLFSSTANINFDATATYVPEITSLAGHTPLLASGNLNLDGAIVRPVFGVAPTGSETWVLGDAAAITGSFTIDDSMAGLSAGQSLTLSQVAGGNGQQLVLGLQNVLTLTVDADSGAASIVSPSGDTINITSYGIASAGGQLNPAGWTSFDSQNISTFDAVGPQDANNLDELAGPIDASTQGSAPIDSLGESIGSPFAAGQPFGVVPDLTFEYTTTDNEIVQGAVVLTGLDAVNNLLLTVDPSTGMGELKNSSNTTLELKGYTIFSDSDSLQPGNGNWLSLDDQNVDQTGAGGADGYVLEANATTDSLSELIPDSLDPSKEERTLTLSPGESYSMGGLFNTSGTQDLSLQFVLEVQGLDGDYNGDSTVNIADYTVWRDNLGSNAVLPGDTTPGDVSAADYQVWKDNFGMSGSGGGLEVFDGVVQYGTVPTGALAGVQAIPEPATWFSLLCGLVGLLFYRRRDCWTSFRKPLLTSAAIVAVFAANSAFAQLDLSAAQVWTSSEQSADRPGEEAFNGVADGNNRWATTFLGGAGDDQSMRNEWLIVDMGTDINIGRIEVNWETARAEDYTWRIRTEAQGLPTPAPIDLDRDSVTYSDWTEIASVVDALSVGNNTDLNNPDQIFDWDNNTTFSENTAVAPTLTVAEPTGRYLMMAITDNWFRNGSTGSSPYEIRVYESIADIVPGDTNGDQMVDATDFQNIRNNFQSAIPGGTSDTAARLLGDIGDSSLGTERDGVVDFYDFIIWEENYQGSESFSLFSSTVVPEPSSAVIGSVALAMVFSCCNRRQRRRMKA